MTAKFFFVLSMLFALLAIFGNWIDNMMGAIVMALWAILWAILEKE